MKIRPDVSAVNLGLLNLPEYYIVLSDEYNRFKKSISKDKAVHTQTQQVFFDVKGLPALPASSLNNLLTSFPVSEHYIGGALGNNVFSILDGKGKSFNIEFKSDYLLRGIYFCWIS